jgi:hypothetical protein
MPRPKNPYPRQRIHIYLRQEVIAKLRILFATEDNMNGIIQGAISRFIETAVEEKLTRIPTSCSSESQNASSMTEQQIFALSDLKTIPTQ